MRFSSIAVVTSLAGCYEGNAFTTPFAGTTTIPHSSVARSNTLLSPSSALFSSEMKEAPAAATTTTTTDNEDDGDSSSSSDSLSSPSSAPAPLTAGSPIPEEDAKEFEKKVAESTAAELAAAAVKAKSDAAATTIPTLNTIDKSKILPGRYDEKENSIAIPFLKRPAKLDGTHAGDFGFDPLGFTEEYDLYTMQESELRHGRLAMLAVIGWPMSELLAPDWMLQGDNHLAPSVLNGFNPLSFLAVVSIFGALGFFEYKTALRRNSETAFGKLHRSDMENVWSYGVAGDYDFDPLNLYSVLGDNAYARKGLREVEISHGRSAMLGITAFVVWEALTGHSIVESGSMFFHPNLALPALVAAYYAFGYFYELDEDAADTFLRFKMSSEGKARWENLKIGMNSGSSGGPSSSNDDGGFDLDTIKEFPQKVSNLATTVKEKYAQLEKTYMDKVVNAGDN